MSEIREYALFSALCRLVGERSSRLPKMRRYLAALRRVTDGRRA
jgi:hypothetical protein